MVGVDVDVRAAAEVGRAVGPEPEDVVLDHRAGRGAGVGDAVVAAGQAVAGGRCADDDVVAADADALVDAGAERAVRVQPDPVGGELRAVLPGDDRGGEIVDREPARAGRIADRLGLVGELEPDAAEGAVREPDDRHAGVARLRGRVDEQRIGDRRQVGGQLDQVDRVAVEVGRAMPAAAGEGLAAVDREVDRVVPGQRVGVEDRLPERTGPGVGCGRHGERVHQAGPVPLARCGDRERRFDRAEAVLQRPVAAECIGPGVVGAGGEIGPGERGEVGEQTAAVGRGGQVAAVEQQVGPVGERRIPGSDLVGPLGQRRPVDPAVPELHRPLGRMRKDVHRIDRLRLRRERLPDPLQPIAGTGQQNDRPLDRRIAPRPQVREQPVQIGQAGVDEDQLAANGDVARCGVARCSFARRGFARCGFARCGFGQSGRVERRRRDGRVGCGERGGRIERKRRTGRHATGRPIRISFRPGGVLPRQKRGELRIGQRERLGRDRCGECVGGCSARFDPAAWRLVRCAGFG